MKQTLRTRQLLVNSRRANATWKFMLAKKTQELANSSNTKGKQPDFSHFSVTSQSSKVVASKNQQ